MAMIQVKLWKNDDTDAGVKFYQRTPGDEVLALNDAEEFVFAAGTQSNRRAHITISGTSRGIFIVRPWDEDNCPDFADRLALLRTRLDEMERGY